MAVVEVLLGNHALPPQRRIPHVTPKNTSRLALGHVGFRLFQAEFRLAHSAFAVSSSARP